MKSGDQISRYRILGSLGKGGMGEVYRAEDSRLNRPVALKFLKADGMTEKDKARFLNEARSAAQLRHPNVCPIYDIEEADGQLFLAMACLEGETLSQKIRHGGVNQSTAIRLAIEIAEGLEAAHSLGIVHRDIKSANIMVSPQGHASILDFGLALGMNQERLTEAGRTVGTPSFMSPEQVKSEAIDGRSDVWSLGVVLYEMVTGKLPFTRSGVAETLFAIAYESAPILEGELGRIIAKALEKDLSLRWQSAAEFATALKSLEAQPAGAALPTRTMEASAPPQPIPVPASRSRWTWAVLGVLLASLLGVGGWRLWLLRDVPEEKQVAVIPFTIVGNADATRAVADGVVEILAAAIADSERFHGKITSVPSSEIRRRKIDNAQDAHKIYGVNLAFTGSAMPSGNEVQFTVSLVNAVKQRQLASRTFLYDPASPMASRNRAVELILDMLRLDATPAEKVAMTAGDSKAPNAYASYLAGRGLLARFDVIANVDKAILAFETALRDDPTYALAYAGLSEAYWRKALLSNSKKYSDLAVEKGEQAAKLDANLPQVQTVLGIAYANSGRQEDAIRALKRAIELAPGSAEAMRQLAAVYANVGRFDEAESLHLDSTRKRPTDWYGFLLLGLFYSDRERYPESEAAFRKAQMLTPDNALSTRNLGGIFLKQGRYKEAIEQYRRATAMTQSATNWGALSGALFYEHRFAECVQAAENAIAIDGDRYWLWGNLGACAKWIPNGKSKSDAALRRAVELSREILQATPTDYDAYANIGEYLARLGDGSGALASIQKIPVVAQKPRTARIALVLELTGRRKQAISLIGENMTSRSSLNQIKDDPDLARLWQDPDLQKAIQKSR